MRPNELSRIEEREAHFFVGRQDELALFAAFLNGDRAAAGIWAVYGTGGVGKSTLLDAFRRMAVQAGAVFVSVDSRDFPHTGEALCRQLLAALPAAESEAPPSPSATPAERCLARIRELAAQGKVAIAFDTYEEMEELDGWLRERLLQWLPDDGVLAILAGRRSPKGPWVVSPAWRERLRRFPLGHLGQEAVNDYLARCRIADDRLQERIWRLTRGHPLAMSLAASDFLQERMAGLDGSGEWFAALADRWLGEVPDPELARLVEEMAVLRHFDREAAACVSGRDIPAALFDRLLALSFVRRSSRGWALHELMREAMRARMRERTPRKFAELTERCIRYYADRIAETAGYADVSWFVGEFFYHGDDAMVTLAFATERQPYRWEPLTRDNLDEARRYADRRHAEAGPVLIEETDPVTGAALRVAMSAQENVQPLAHLELEPLLSLGIETVALLRDEGGETAGLAAVVPINERSLAYLQRDRFASVYFAKLDDEELASLAVAASGQSGWFIRTIDIRDWTDKSLLQECFYLLCRYLAAGGLFVASPPPNPFFRASHTSLGFEIVPGAVHCHYDGSTPTPFFRLDTRGGKLAAFLQRMTGRYRRSEDAPLTGEEAARAADDARMPDGERTTDEIGGTAALEPLSKREREVVALVFEGLTNAEIAERLYVSEVTVKKHLTSVYGKLMLKNRSQLIKLQLDPAVGRTRPHSP